MNADLVGHSSGAASQFAPMSAGAIGHRNMEGRTANTITRNPIGLVCIIGECMPTMNNPESSFCDKMNDRRSRAGSSAAMAAAIVRQKWIVREPEHSKHANVKGGTVSKREGPASGGGSMSLLGDTGHGWWDPAVAGDALAQGLLTGKLAVREQPPGPKRKTQSCST
ncbi:hypothetical protein CEXT_671351 [Caerostris extrusa]|uniref:Uncharacterized protein n=1 Tax=Caerostris extrusa TaxID=172846 RepID=A0AAV4VMU5_CAEEX|nr:hypothetical protein CEXT_671351 [Caerostris extrusa]